METIFIENYRGKDIFYSPSKEKFYADIDEAKEKNGIHLVRKDIDEYIKENQNFKPFEAVNTYYLTPKFVTVTGVRKDKAFQCTGGGNKFLIMNLVIHILQNGQMALHHT